MYPFCIHTVFLFVSPGLRVSPAPGKFTMDSVRPSNRSLGVKMRLIPSFVLMAVGQALEPHHTPSSAPVSVSAPLSPALLPSPLSSAFLPRLSASVQGYALAPRGALYIFKYTPVQQATNYILARIQWACGKDPGHETSIFPTLLLLKRNKLIWRKVYVKKIFFLSLFIFLLFFKYRYEFYLDTLYSITMETNNSQMILLLNRNSNFIQLSFFYWNLIQKQDVQKRTKIAKNIFKQLCYISVYLCIEQFQLY